jgi:hypothetical protein
VLGCAVDQLSDDEDVVWHVSFSFCLCEVCSGGALDELVRAQLGDQRRGLLLRGLALDELHLLARLRDEEPLELQARAGLARPRRVQAQVGGGQEVTVFFAAAMICGSFG